MLENQTKSNQDFSDALAHVQDRLKELIRSQHQLDLYESPHNKKKLQKANQDLQQAMDQLAGQIQFDSSFSQAMAQAAQETKDVKDGLKSLIGGLKAGSGEAELKKVPLRGKIKLSETLSDNPKVKKIAEWAGRFKTIERKKQKSKSQESIERSGVTMGNHVEKLKNCCLWKLDSFPSQPLKWIS